MFAFDATPAEVAALRSGAITALVSQGPYATGVDGVKAIVTYLKAHANSHGKVTPAQPVYTASPSMILTRQNVNSSQGNLFVYRSHC